MADRNAGKYFVSHVIRTTSPISLRNPGFPQSTHPLSPGTWLVHGAIAQSFWPIYKVTKLPFRTSDNATFQTVMTLQNPVIHNAQKYSYLILKIALFENLTISVRQAAVATQHTMTFRYDRPLERHS